jgi:hypothetical protein
VSSTAEQEQFAYNDDFDNLTYPAVASIEEELEPAPAGNAPDWLNAMVPGLDVDYAAEEDQAVEQSFAAAPPGKLDWLNEIVEEESQHLAPVAQAPMTLPTALPKRRFVFTRPPAWLRSASAAPVSAVASATTSAAAAPAKDDMPDWLRDNHEDDDNSNDDLPDWLK